MINTAPVAQLDRVSGYEPEGRAFESLRVHQQLSHQRAHRLAVRTLPFHGGNRGSIPRGRTNILFHAYEIILTKAHSFIWCAFVVFSLIISGQLAHIKTHHPLACSLSSLHIPQTHRQTCASITTSQQFCCSSHWFSDDICMKANSF